MRYFSGFAIAVIASTSVAQQTGDSRAFGYWSITSESGLTGTLSFSPTLCRYEVRSAFATYSAFCTPNWNPSSGELMLYGTSGVGSQTIPDYQPGRQIDTASGNGSPILSFVIDNIAQTRLSGHLLGVGENEHITFSRH